jgi:hypothetical protein
MGAATSSTPQACRSESGYLMMRKDFLPEDLHSQFAMLQFGSNADLGFFLRSKVNDLGAAVGHFRRASPGHFSRKDLCTSHSERSVHLVGIRSLKDENSESQLEEPLIRELEQFLFGVRERFRNLSAR